MQMIRSVVGGEMKRCAVERELSLRDAVAVPPDDGAEVRGCVRYPWSSSNPSTMSLICRFDRVR